MALLRITALFILSLLALEPAYSQQGGGQKVSVQTGRFEAFMSAGYLGISRGSMQFDLAPGFQVVPFPKINWLQVGGDITYQKISVSGGSTSNMMIMGGVTGNLGGATLNESFFVSLGLAIRSGSSDLEDTDGESPNGFGFYFLTGKRFPLGGPWCFRPSMGVVATGSTGMIFRPFAVSYHF